MAKTKSGHQYANIITDGYWRIHKLLKINLNKLRTKIKMELLTE